MNWVDIGIAVVLVLFMFSGLRQGIIKAVLSLVGLSLGITLASRYSPVLAPRLAFIPQPGAASIAAFVIILLGVLIIAGILGFILTGIASVITLGWLNRLGGAVFGLFIGTVLAGTAIVLWVRWLGPNNAIKGSFLATLLVDKFPLVLNLLPPEFDVVRQFFR